ncbi:MAG: P-II family nitrogen regulator [Planctomycetota bacterium]|jgi:nitrogen regulatory protein P-II 1|nr:P-II family nitrogen regulator [Planctomycetota bacterium]
MRKIEILIRPEQLEAVKQALLANGVQGLTMTEVRGFGRQGGHKEVYRGKELWVEFLPKLKLEAVARAESVDAIVDAVCAAAGTGQVGDGKIFIQPVLGAARIRTRETGPDAL